MATIGLKYLGCSKMQTEPNNAVPTYGIGKVLGKTISAQLAITNAEGELFADDMLAEYVSEFSSAALTAEVDNISLENQAEMYGGTYVDGEMQLRPDDTAPYLGLGGYQALIVSGVRKFRSWFFPKSKAAVPDWSGTTKGSSISFGNQPIKSKIMAPNYGPWYRVKEFATESAAKAYIDGLLNIENWHSMNVQVQGDDTGDGATPVGLTSVADGEDFVLTITGTPTALYDNGIDSVSSISGGKYTLSAVSADHTIAVIF